MTLSNASLIHHQVPSGPLILAVAAIQDPMIFPLIPNHARPHNLDIPTDILLPVTGRLHCMHRITIHPPQYMSLLVYMNTAYTGKFFS